MGDLAFSGAGLGRVAVDSEYGTSGGKYIQSKNSKLHETKSSGVSYDAQSASKLWQASERLVGLQQGEQPSSFGKGRA